MTDSCANASEVFQKQQSEDGHSLITLLCTLKNEDARKKYLALTRDVALPLKASNPACIRVTQTIPKNSEQVQVLWIQEWTSSQAFSDTMKKIFSEFPQMKQVNDYLSCNPVLTVSRIVSESDYK